MWVKIIDNTREPPQMTGALCVDGDQVLSWGNVEEDLAVGDPSDPTRPIFPTEPDLWMRGYCNLFRTGYVSAIMMQGDMPDDMKAASRRTPVEDLMYEDEIGGPSQGQTDEIYDETDLEDLSPDEGK